MNTRGSAHPHQEQGQRRDKSRLRHEAVWRSPIPALPPSGRSVAPTATVLHRRHGYHRRRTLCWSCHLQRAPAACRTSNDERPTAGGTDFSAPPPDRMLATYLDNFTSRPTLNPAIVGGSSRSRPAAETRKGTMSPAGWNRRRRERSGRRRPQSRPRSGGASGPSGPLKRSWYKIRAEPGLDWLGIHDLRHACAISCRPREPRPGRS
jgi:hypothetical protein